MENQHILLADDEKAITDYLAPLLERTGFRVTVAHDGESTLHQIHKLRPDLVVLDVMMPVVDGREVCRRLRRSGNWTPVIILSQLDTSLDKILSLEEGADDYLCKPFDPQELVARIRAVLRRRSRALHKKPLSMAEKLRAGELLLDRPAHRLEKNGRILDITPKAYALIEHLMLHHDQVLIREQLMDAVWGWAQPVATRAVDMRIAELRRALNDEADQPVYIETVIGMGYRWLMPVEIVE